MGDINVGFRCPSDICGMGFDVRDLGRTVDLASLRTRWVERRRSLTAISRH